MQEASAVLFVVIGLIAGLLSGVFGGRQVAGWRFTLDLQSAKGGKDGHEPVVDPL